MRWIVDEPGYNGNNQSGVLRDLNSPISKAMTAILVETVVGINASKPWIKEGHES